MPTENTFHYNAVFSFKAETSLRTAQDSFRMFVGWGLLSIWGSRSETMLVLTLEPK